MKNLKLLPMALIVLLGVVPSVWAQEEVDPELLFIGSGGCLLTESCPFLYGGTQVHPIGANTLDIMYHSNGNHGTIIDPILLILGIPNDTSGTAAPAISSVSAGLGTLGGPNTYGGTWNVSTGYVGQFSSSTDPKVYKFIGLVPPGSASQNWTNWYGADLAVTGIDASSFGIYIYTLTSQNLDPGELVTINFAADYPIGTYAIAYGCDNVTGSGGSARCASVGDTYATPFTRSGLRVDGKVPEPGTILLLGSGLLGVAIFGWRFHRRG